MITAGEKDHLKKKGKSTGTFYFKQFKVEDGRSTMKVGTDAVLLGAFADVGEAEQILEIGTGCGVISLILAQRSNAQIDAIDIDEESVKQARENAGNSPWNDRINIIHSSLQDFVKHSERKYDLLVSNPPFFSNALKSPNEKRNISRHNDLLSYEELIIGSSGLMSAGGSLWVVLPAKESVAFIDIAVKSGLFLHFKVKVISKAKKECHRVLIQFKNTPSEKVKEKSLAIKNADNSYSMEYIELTKEFYIDF